MRLIHIFWSLIVLAAMIIFPIILFLNHGKLQGGPELFGTFLIFWWIIDAATPIVLIAAWITENSLSGKFLFTLLAILNLYFGLQGIYHLLRARIVHQYGISFLFFLLNLAWFAMIAYFQIQPLKIDRSGVDHS